MQKNWPANYSGRNRPYDFEGNSGASAPSGGSLFDYAKRAGISYRSYGEFSDFASKPPNVRPARFMPALAGHISPIFPGYDMSVSDQARFDAWKREFDGYVKNGDLPRLSEVGFDARAVLEETSEDRPPRSVSLGGRPAQGLTNS